MPSKRDRRDIMDPQEPVLNTAARDPITGPPDYLPGNLPPQDYQAGALAGMRPGMLPPGRMPGAGLPDAAGPRILYGRNDEIPEEDRNLNRIGEKEIEEATNTLTKYKNGKANLERQIVENEEWYRLRHWDIIRRQKKKEDDQSASSIEPEPSSGWLFNAILNKHADAMDNYPEPVVLPREKSDEQSARLLSSILPVVMENCKFEKAYSNNWWAKLKHGVAAYGVFWNTKKDNGVGDIDIKEIDILKVFWEPGIKEIQDSRNLFIVELVDTDLLEQQYPDRKGKLGGNTIDVTEYKYDDAVDTSGKSLVVDWYYKIQNPEGRTILHYAKFVGKELLFASENDPEYSDRGFYDHGLYPVVFDVLYPVAGTPVGFGMVAICKDPQLYIDKLSQNIMETSLMGSKKRFFVSNSTNIRKEDLLDWNNPIIPVEGDLSDLRLREVSINTLSPIYYQVMQGKIEEMKDTSANRDVNSGGTSSGVSAASAIAALQEAGNKSSRDMISQSYRAYTEIVELCLELIRQFYDETRSFRITGQNPGEYQFVDMNNAILKDIPNGISASGQQLYREPIFDLKIKAQKKSPFSRMEQNERAKELYGLGFFNPERAQEALGALEMMDFEGIDKVKEQAAQGQTLLNIVQQMSQQMQQMASIISQFTGQAVPAGAPAEGIAAGGSAAVNVNAATDENPAAQNKVASGVMQAQTPMTSYGNRLAKRSAPNMDVGNELQNAR